MQIVQAMEEQRAAREFLVSLEKRLPLSAHLIDQAQKHCTDAAERLENLRSYEMQVMLLEQQNKKRLLMARQEQDVVPSNPTEQKVPQNYQSSKR